MTPTPLKYMSPDAEEIFQTQRFKSGLAVIPWAKWILYACWLPALPFNIYTSETVFISIQHILKFLMWLALTRFLETLNQQDAATQRMGQQGMAALLHILLPVTNSFLLAYSESRVMSPQLFLFRALMPVSLMVGVDMQAQIIVVF